MLMPSPSHSDSQDRKARSSSRCAITGVALTQQVPSQGTSVYAPCRNGSRRWVAPSPSRAPQDRERASVFEHRWPWEAIERIGGDFPQTTCVMVLSGISHPCYILVSLLTQPGLHALKMTGVPDNDGIDDMAHGRCSVKLSHLRSLCMSFCS